MVMYNVMAKNQPRRYYNLMRIEIDDKIAAATDVFLH